MSEHPFFRIIHLPGNGWRREEPCGCGRTVRDGVAYFSLCRGHGGATWEEPNSLTGDDVKCACGERHEWKNK